MWHSCFLRMRPINISHTHNQERRLRFRLRPAHAIPQRRLGDFLKELKLTEGHATGLPAMRKAMHQNGSPAPVFDFDEELTWFQVMLPIHTAFELKQAVVLDLQGIKWNSDAIDKILNEVLEKTGFHEAIALSGVQAGTIAGDIAGTIVELLKSLDNQAIEVMEQVDGTIAGTIAGVLADILTDKEIKLLSSAKQPIDRKNLLKTIGLKNLRHNYDAHAKHLEEKNWLTMTIPDKPTSPKQQYLTTLKGRLILEFLKYRTR